MDSVSTQLTRSHSIVGFHPEGRPSDDFYPTPRNATTALLESVKFDKLVWECACGDGAMSRVIEEYGYKVYSSDLFDRGYGKIGVDFLQTIKPWSHSIITNPPFKYSQAFMEHALSLGCNKLALLNKLQFLEGVKRSEVLQTTPLKHVLVFRKRLTMMRDGRKPTGGGMITFAWFVWERGYDGAPEIGWI